MSLEIVALWCTLLILITASCTAPPPNLSTTVTPAPPQALAANVVDEPRVITREIMVTATPTPPAPCTPTSLAEANEIVIGLIAPFSQNAAWPRALAMQAGAGLALEDINRAGGINGKPVRMVLQDTAGDPQAAARLADSLITQDCASALVGGFTTDEAAAIKQVSLQYGTPFLIVDATADELTSDRPASVFRIAPAASMIAQMPTRWLATVGDYNGDGAQQVLLIVENTANGDAMLEQARQAFPAAGIPYDVLRVDVPMDDYSPLIARVVAREQAADAIMLYVTGDASLGLLRQLLDAGIGPQKGTLLVVGRAALDGGKFWSQVPDGAFTVIGRRGPWSTSVTEMGRSFAERYAAWSDHWPEPAAFAGYDAVLLLADAVQRAPSMQPGDLVSALEGADVTLASGYYQFPFNSQRPPNGDLEPPYLWHQWPDPALLYLQYREAQQDPATIDVIWPPIYRTTDVPVLKP